MSEDFVRRKDKTRNCNILKDVQYDVYCGRGVNGLIPSQVGSKGWLGNPIKVYEECIICRKVHKRKGDTLACYRIYLEKRLVDIEFKKEFDKLKGKKLGCFCKPEPCHTDIMIEYL